MIKKILSIFLVSLFFSGILTTKTFAINPFELIRELELNSVHFPSTDEGWAVGRDELYVRGIIFFRFYERAVILHYNNGEWNVVPLPTKRAKNWELNSVHFPSTDEGWAVGRDRRAEGEYWREREKAIILH